MDRIAELRHVLTNPEASSLTGTEPVDRLLLHVIVHLAAADGEVDEAEQAYLGRLMPAVDADTLLRTIDALRHEQLEVGLLEEAVPELEDQRRLLQLAEDFVRMNGVLDEGEERLLAALRQEIG